jgi:hypothetical protein
VEDAMIARYVAASGVCDAAFRAGYRILGLQRNLRILGVFARLCLRDGKARYVDLIPRVWGHLQRDLAHPSLAALRAHLAEDLPPPTPAILQGLKDQCATIPAP